MLQRKELIGGLSSGVPVTFQGMPVINSWDQVQQPEKILALVAGNQLVPPTHRDQHLGLGPGCSKQCLSQSQFVTCVGIPLQTEPLLNPRNE